MEIREIVRLWTYSGRLRVTRVADGGITCGLETISAAALVDIARSLRELVSLAKCPNVATGFRAMEKARRVLERMDKRRRKSPRGRNK